LDQKQEIKKEDEMSTVAAFDPFPSTDEPEKRPLKEFRVKFSVFDGKRPLTLDFNTFCSSAGLDYNNGKYVNHPTPKSTVAAFDPFPSTDEPDKRPLKEFRVKFSVFNGQRPLTLDFNTFCSSAGLDYNNAGLDYNNGKYVNHPTPKVVKKELGKIAINPSYQDKTPVLKNSFPVAWRILFTFVIQDKNFGFLPSILSNFNFTKDPSKVTDIELTAHMIVVNSQKDSLSLLPLAAKPKKGKSQTVTPTLPKSQGPEIPGALFKKSKRPKYKRLPTETKVIPPKPMEDSEQSHSVSSGTVPDPQDLERNIQLASMGFPSTLNEGTHKSKPLPESIATHPKDSKGNKQPLDRDITSTTPDEGTAKTMPRPEELLGDIDSEGNIPPVVIEPIHTPVDDLLGTDNQAFLLFEDELEKETDEEEVLAAGDDIDEDPQDDVKVGTPSPNQTQPEPSNVQESASDLSNPDLKRFDNTLPLTERQLIKYLRKISRAFIEEYYEENIAHRDQTDQLVAASMSSLDKSSSSISDLYKGLNVITELLKDINNAIKDDPATNKKIDEAIKTFSKISTQTTETLSFVKTFDFSTLQFTKRKVQSSYPYPSQMNHQTSSVPQIAYQSPQVSTQPMTESPLVDSGFAVLIFSSRDDLIACLNKAMAFLIAIASSRLKSLILMIIDCDDISNAKAVLMANISNYGSDVISELPHSETYLNDIEYQSLLARQDFEQLQ
nr:hypothetical protein [Tanacetum cinerariifolium]